MEKLIFCNLDLLKNKPDENDYEEYDFSDFDLNSSPINVIYSCISLKNYRKNRTIKSIFIVERLIY